MCCHLPLSHVHHQFRRFLITLFKTTIPFFNCCFSFIVHQVHVTTREWQSVLTRMAEKRERGTKRWYVRKVYTCVYIWIYKIDVSAFLCRANEKFFFTGYTSYARCMIFWQSLFSQSPISLSLPDPNKANSWRSDIRLRLRYFLYSLAHCFSTVN